MSNAQGESGGPLHDHVEIGVAIGIALFGVIVIIGSLQVGIGWGIEGPRAGFLPFYFGLIIVASSLINLWNAFREADYKSTFASWGQLYSVMSVVVPTAFYVIAVPYIGIYVASFLLIAFFMRWIGKYGWPMVATLSIGVPLVCFIVFERWFLVSLPKGPIEEWLGF
jgi:putative tricarboxylic transport membrane protein